MTFISYAQNFEDVMLWRALKHVENGFYIDVGAGHPDEYSVTRAFYDRGWRGINIEPTNRIDRLAGARPRDLNIQAAVGQVPDKLTLFVVEDNKDISTLDPAIAQGHRTAGWKVSESTVPVVTLADICREHVRFDISFLKIDVEGAERDVLFGADFGQFRPWIVVIEATAPNSQVPTHADWEELLTNAEYRFAWFDGLNRFYIGNEHWEHLSSAFTAPPNVFDDFIRATDTEHLNRIVAAEVRAAAAETRLAQADTRLSEADRLATQAETRAVQAEAYAQTAEARVTEAEARAKSSEVQALEAVSRAARTEELMAQAEARAVAAETRALAAETRARAAEAHAARSDASLTEMAARHNEALCEIAALRTSTSWRLSAPLRVVRWFLSAHFGAALMEAGISQDRVERLKTLTASVVRRTSRLSPVTLPGRLRPRSVVRDEIPYVPQLTVATGTPFQPSSAISSTVSYSRKVHQFHAGSWPGDAVTNSMLLIQRLLCGLGYTSDIFVEHRHPELADRLLQIDDLPHHGDYILIVHHSMGYDACERITSLPARKILLYHNITPPEFLNDFPEYIPYAELGRRQLSVLRPYMAAALADSEFNALELRKHGYDSPVACQFLLDVDRLIVNASKPSLHSEQHLFTVLFVGRVVASKGQADLIDAFAEFRRQWSAPCRLVLIGRMASPDAAYPREIRRRICQHNLQDAVFLTGPISDAELWERYKAADLYVSLSLHEGFGVPLVEAMAHGIPVLAWPAGAIPYTLDGCGELLPDRSPPVVAAAMLRIARDPGLRERIVVRQREALGRFRLDRQLPRLTQALVKAGAAAPSDPEECQAFAANLRFTITGHATGTYSLAAINRCLGLSLEAQYPGAVRFVPWENGPVADPSSVSTCSIAPMAKLFTRVEHVTGPEVVISHHYPVYVPQVRGDLCVAMVFWEESLIPLDTIRLLNSNFDAVFAPSSTVASALINSGLAIPVRIIGVAPDLTMFRRARAERRSCHLGARRPFTFLHVSSCFARKGVDVLLAAYAKAFRKEDPVRLVIKGFPNPHNDVPEQIEQLQQHHPQLAQISLINNDLNDEGMVELYRDADAVVLPTRGEGFNLPAAEAMAAGIPLIVTNYGGHLDFCTAEEARLINFHFAGSRSHLASGDSVWAEPDLDDLASAMRSLFEDIVGGPAEATARASRAYDVIAERLDSQAWAGRIADAATELITADHAGKLRLAWVSTWEVQCGIAEYSRCLIEGLIARPEAVGQSTVVLCEDRTSASTRADGIRVCPSWHLGEAASMTRLARAISAEDPDVVVIQHHRGILPWDGLINLLTDRRVSHRIIVVTLHAAQHLLDLGTSDREAVLAVLARVTRVLVHRAADLNSLKQLGLTRNTALFPQGAPQLANTPIIRKLSEQTTPVIGCFGFFLPGKGIPRLIEAVAELRSKWPQLRLRLVNAEYPVPVSGSEIARCRALADSAGVSRLIEWHTEFLPIDECLRLLSGCDLLVLPYDPTEESSSAALRTALASGVPTAVTPIAIFEEANDAVYRFAGSEVEAVAAGIDLLLRDSKARRSLQCSASAWLAERDWATLSERILGMLRGLCVTGRIQS